MDHSLFWKSKKPFCPLKKLSVKDKKEKVLKTFEE